MSYSDYEPRRRPEERRRTSDYRRSTDYRRTSRTAPNYRTSGQNVRRSARYYRRKSNKKPIAIGLAVAVLVVLLAITAITVFSPKNPPVQGVMIEKVSADSITLSWDKVKDADGYYIYGKTGSTDKYEKLGEASDGKTTATVTKLAQASKYSLYVTAYSSGAAESPDHTAISAMTLPGAPAVTAVKSKEEGVAVVSWKPSKNVKGYIIQYAAKAGSKLDKAKTTEVKGAKTTTAKIRNLVPGMVYSIRMSAYITNGSKKQSGDWSKYKNVTISENYKLPDYIDASKPMIALTFDDGPGYNTASKRILDVLEKYNAKASFFMVGTNAQNHPDNLKRKVELGMEIGNHTWNHAHYGQNVTPSDISMASDAIYKACGRRPTAFRSPGGMTTDAIKEECKKENMALYYWSVDTEDWRSRNADAVYNVVMNQTGDGDIVLMHEIYESTADAVERIVPKLIKKGYQLVTCRDLISAKTGASPEVGKQYVSG